MKKILKSTLVILFIFITGNNSVFAANYTYIDFGELRDMYGNKENRIVKDVTGSKTINLGTGFNTLYYTPTKRYITEIKYLKKSRSLSDSARDYLIDWNTVSNKSRSYDKEDVNTEVIKQDMNMFYKEIFISHKGKTFWVLAQRSVADDLEKNVKNGQFVKAKILVVGKRIKEIPVIIITGYIPSKEVKKEDKEKEDLELQYVEVVNLIQKDKNNQAISKLTYLKNKYPKNLDIRIDICSIKYMEKQYTGAIKCYEELLKKDRENYRIHYGLGMSYFSSSMDKKKRSQLTIRHLDKAIPSLKARQHRQMKYNSYYARANAKLSLGDKAALDDFAYVNKRRPDLVDKGTIERVRKILGVKE